MVIMITIIILSLCAFLTSCDDFFSPTIEIFNKLENPNTIEQDHGQSQNQEQKKKKEKNNINDTIVIGDTEFLVN